MLVSMAEREQSRRFQSAKVQRKTKGCRHYTLNNVNRQKITSRMFEDEALGFCYALQCYSSQDENRYPSPMFRSPIHNKILCAPLAICPVLIGAMCFQITKLSKLAQVTFGSSSIKAKVSDYLFCGDFVFIGHKC